MVRKLKGLCLVNEKNCKGEVVSCLSEKIARRISLDCEPCQSPQPPHLASARAGQPNVLLGRPTNSRFQVSKVRDTTVPSSPRYRNLIVIIALHLIKLTVGLMLYVFQCRWNHLLCPLHLHFI